MYQAQLNRASVLAAEARKSWTPSPGQDAKMASLAPLFIESLPEFAGGVD